MHYFNLGSSVFKLLSEIHVGFLNITLTRHYISNDSMILSNSKGVYSAASLTDWPSK